MGINGLLPRILPSAGQENYNLSALSDGVISLTSCPSNCSRHGKDDDDDNGDTTSSTNYGPAPKRRRTTTTTTTSSSNNNNHQLKIQKQPHWIRRKFRIAVDVNGWIARAVHGHGAHLLDERHLSYHGRAELRTEHRIHKQGEGDPTKSTTTVPTDANTKTNEGAAAAAAQQKKQQEEIQNQQRLEYMTKCISFVLHRIEYLRNECGADVLPVLDGNTPPCKRDTVKIRSDRRKRASEQRDHAAETQEEEEEEEEEADITEAEALRRISASKRAGMGGQSSLRQELTTSLLSEFRKREWPFIVAPYEADGQLAYLAKNGLVDLVVTEDSDLIALGIPTLVYRLGGWNGANSANRDGFWNDGNARGSSFGGYALRGTILHRRDLGASHGINLMDFSDAMLVTMFVVAGCDYCESLKGIGIITARNIVKRAFHGREANEPEHDGDHKPTKPVLREILEDIYQSCHKEARLQVLPLDDPEKEEARLAYEQSFLGALAMFRHPLVYDPILCKNIIANDVCNDRDESVSLHPSFLRDERILMEYAPYKELATSRKLLYQVIGSPFAPKIAKDIAEGIVDPRTAEHDNDIMPENDSPQEEEERANFTLLTQQDSQQPFSQDFGGAGTQQTKSSSSTSKGFISSLSPDLLASPSPVKYYI